MPRINLLAVLCLGLLASCTLSEPERPDSVDALVEVSSALTNFDGGSLLWSGETFCPNNCRGTGSQYACSSGPDAGVWNDGEQTFQDPTGGGLVVGIKAEVFGRFTQSADAGTTAADLKVLLNSQELGQVSVTKDACSSSDKICGPVETVNYTNGTGVPDYVYRGTNTLRLEVPSGVRYCLSHIKVTVTTATRSFVITPSAGHNFGKQKRSTTSGVKLVEVKNTGEAFLELTPSVDGGYFSVSPATQFSLQPDASTSLQVTFTPTAVTALDGGVGALIFTSSNTGNPPPTALRQSISLVGTGVASGLEPSFTTHTFATPQTVGLPSASQALTLYNISDETLQVAPLVAPPFAISPTGSRPINAGASFQYNVTFIPTDAGTASGTLSFSTSDPTDNTTVSLTGTGIKANLVVPPGVFFTEQRVGERSAPTSVTVTNTGSAPITISSLEYPSSFEVDGGVPFNLDVDGGSKTLQVVFKPVAEGPVPSDTALVLVSNDPSWRRTNIPLRGTGTLPTFVVTPASLSFDPQTAGTPSPAREVSVVNTGSASTRITSLTLEGNDGGVFAVTASPDLAIPLAADGGTKTLFVTFNPNAKTTFAGNLKVNTDHALVTANIPLAGEGTSQLVMSPLSPDGGLDFGNVRVGTNDAGVTITLTNTSTAPIDLSHVALSPLGPPFTVSSLSTLRLNGRNDTATFRVTFSPPLSQEGVVREASISVFSNASNGPEHPLPIRGKGVAAEARLISEDGGTAVSTLDFGPVRLTTSALRTVRLFNGGDVSLSFPLNQPPEITGDPGFSYLGPSTLTLPAGESLPFQVSFRPTKAAIAYGTLKIYSDAKNSPLLLNLSAMGTYSEVKLDRSSVSFGDVRVGQLSNPVAVRITNSGTAVLSVQSVSVTGNFDAHNPLLPDGGSNLPDGGTSLPLLIPPEASTTFNVFFKPSKGEVLDGSVAILTDANLGGGTRLSDGGTDNPGVLNVALQGHGTLAELKLSDDLAFGTQRLGVASSPQPVILSNTGEAELRVSQLVFSNPAFDILAPDAGPTPQSPLTIGGGVKATVYVRFTPQALGQTTGKLQVISDAHLPSSAPTLNLTGTGVDGTIVMTPAAVSFGQVEVGGNGAQQSMLIKNGGGAPLTITEAPTVSPSSFSVSGLSQGLVLNPGAEWPFKVTYRPLARGDEFGTLTLNTDTQVNETFNLSLSGTGVAPQAELQPTEISFSKSNIGVPATRNISVKNVGERPLSIAQITFEDVPDGGVGALQDFEYVASLPMVVQPPPDGGSTIVPLKFIPKVEGMRVAKVIFHTNVPTLDGGIVTARVQGEGTAPGLELSPSPDVSFGKVLVNSPSSPLNVTITNSGTGPLKVTKVSVGGNDSAYFTLAPVALPFTLEAGGSQTVTLTLRPDAERQFLSSLLVETDSLPSKTLNLVGEGVRQQVAVTPSNLEFGNRLLNTPVTVKDAVRITNSSDTVVTITGLSVDGVGAEQFTTNRSPPFEVMASDAGVLDVTFTPQEEVRADAKLKITVGNLPTPFEVQLRGKGIPTVLSVAAAPPEFGTIRVGNSSEMTLTLRNLSEEPITLGAPKIAWKRGEVFTYPDGLGEEQTIPKGGVLNVRVQYSPKQEVLSETQVTFNTTKPPLSNAAEVLLRGTATARLLGVDPSSLDFGQVDVKDPLVPRTVTVVNNSTEPQRVVVMLRTPEGTPFSFDRKDLPLSLPPGASGTLTVGFDPTSAGAVENEVQVWIEGASSPEAGITVKGHGRSLTAQGSGCSSGAGAGTAGVLALLTLVGLVSRRRRRA